MTAVRKMVACPQCSGKGKVAVDVIEGKELKVKDTWEINCVTCHGAGQITVAAERQYRRELAGWCQCGNPSQEADYHPDTPRMKHHWTCRDCGKLYQVG